MSMMSMWMSMKFLSRLVCWLLSELLFGLRGLRSRPFECSQSARSGFPPKPFPDLSAAPNTRTRTRDRFPAGTPAATPSSASPAFWRRNSPNSARNSRPKRPHWLQVRQIWRQNRSKWRQNRAHSAPSPRHRGAGGPRGGQRGSRGRRAAWRRAAAPLRGARRGARAACA